jgi:hypothetical protein
MNPLGLFNDFNLNLVQTSGVLPENGEVDGGGGSIPGQNNGGGGSGGGCTVSPEGP